MVLCILNAMVPHIWQYLGYWWNGLSFPSTMITFDGAFITQNQWRGRLTSQTVTLDTEILVWQRSRMRDPTYTDQRDKCDVTSWSYDQTPLSLLRCNTTLFQMIQCRSFHINHMPKEVKTLNLWYSLSNVILADEKSTLFHQYLRYSHKCGPLCSVYQAPCNEPNLTFLAPFPTDLAYLSMLFILVMACTAGSAGHHKNTVWQKSC